MLDASRWLTVRLGDLCTVVRGGSPRPAGDPRFFGGSFIPWLTVAAITNVSSSKAVITETAGFLTEAGSIRSRRFQPGTVVIANSGWKCGVAKILGFECCGNDGVAGLENLTGADPRFISYWINSQTENLRSRSAAGNEQPNLNTDRIAALMLPFPDLKEQEAIAKALSDADSLIEGLERLIAKKRRIKRGAMQDLLTAKRRLPGFSGEWSPKKFGDISRIRNQKVQTLGDVRAERCIELEQIEGETGRLRFWTNASDRSTSKYLFTPGDTLFGRLRPYLRKYHLASSEGVCSTEIWPLMAIGVTPSFLYHIIQSDPFIAAACESYGTHMPRADWGKLLTFELNVPDDPDEQNAIGSVLLDMDAEIQALETRLEKAQAVKEGMMQNLLTGRIRLV